MKAIAHQGEGLDGASYRDMDRPETGPGQVCVQLKAAALNHRDIWTCNRADPNGAPVILGSDGAGIVADSDPKSEHEECRNKALGLLRAAAEAVRFAQNPN